VGDGSILTIRTTPRTGSNLLMHSLAKHPEVKSAGEYYCVEESRCTVEAWSNKKSGDWNLTKTFFLEEPPKLGLTLFLCRKDIEAQHASYIKACSTGEWMSGMVSDPVQPLHDFVHLVEETNRRIAPLCDLVFTYEDLVESWDESIRNILNSWGLQQLSLDKATKKQ